MTLKYQNQKNFLEIILTPKCSNNIALSQLQKLSIKIQNLTKFVIRILRKNQLSLFEKEKLMTSIKNKIKKVQYNFYGSYSLIFLSRNSFTLISISEKAKLEWVLSPRLKKEFVNTFQAELLKVKKKSTCTMEVLWADGGRKFIFVKSRIFCKKRNILLQYKVIYMHKVSCLAERG